MFLGFLRFLLSQTEKTLDFTNYTNLRHVHDRKLKFQSDYRAIRNGLSLPFGVQ